MSDSAFLNRFAKTKLAEKPIVWSEAYTDRTKFLKEQFEDVIGSGSYFRFEGKDADTGDEYFVVVGPARVRAPKAMFFAGVRKLPSDYAAGGLYFAEMNEAMEYAQTTWGVPRPKDMGYYDASDLRGIGRRLREWRNEREGGQNGEAEKAATTPVVGTERDVPGSPLEVTQPVAEIEKAAMAERRKGRTGYRWFDLDRVIAGDPEFEREVPTQPSLGAALNEALGERAKRRMQIARWYGPEYMEADFYKIWLSHKPDEGTYLVAVGPYLGTHYGQAKDKFYMGVKKLNLAEQSEIDEKVESLIMKYSTEFGVRLTRDDLNIPTDEKPMVGEITIGKSGRQKIYDSGKWKQKILDYYGVVPGKGAVSKLKDEYKRRKEEWKGQLDAAYARSQASGDAFLNQQPPPPKVDLSKRAYGQQQFETVYREDKPPEVEGEEAVVKYGFDSLREAVDRLGATMWAGVPLADVPPTTAEDLARARRLHEESGEAPEVSVPPRTAPSRVPRQPEVKTEPKPAEPAAKPAEAEKPSKAPPAKLPVPKMVEQVPEEIEVPNFFAKAVESLVKLAESFDARGMCDKAEEVHRILRKHVDF